MTKKLTKRWIERVHVLCSRIDYRNELTFRRLIKECRKLSNGSAKKFIEDCRTKKERARLAEVFDICATFNPSILSSVGSFIMMEKTFSEHELHENILNNMNTLGRLELNAVPFVIHHFYGENRDLHRACVKIFYQAINGKSVVSKTALKKLQTMRKDIEKSIDRLRNGS